MSTKYYAQFNNLIARYVSGIKEVSTFPVLSDFAYCFRLVLIARITDNCPQNFEWEYGDKKHAKIL